MKYFIKTKLSENISETPEGYLLCKNVMLTHTGKLEYLAGEHPFEDIKEPMIVTRDSKELFSEQTISSFTGKSITIQHPEDWVTPENWQEETNGVVMNVRPSPEKVEIDGEMQDVLLGDFLITTRRAIEEVHSGLREVSLGYDAVWVQDGDRTAKHTQIRGNHCALVENGRAGIECAIKDSKGDISMSLKEKFETLFGMTVDSAIKKKEKEVAAKKAKDEAEAAKKEAEAAAKKKADDEAAEAAKKEAEKKTNDEGVEERLAKLEEMLAAIVEQLSGNESEAEVESEAEEIEEEVEENSEEVDEDEEVNDEDEGSEEDLEVNDEEESEGKNKKTSDTLARAEILAPGIRDSKDVKRKSLEAAFRTADGKAIIKPLLGGKNIADLGKGTLQSVFYAASELMKQNRIDNHAKVKSVTIDSFPSLKQRGMTPQMINEANQKRYNK